MPADAAAGGVGAGGVVIDRTALASCCGARAAAGLVAVTLRPGAAAADGRAAGSGASVSRHQQLIPISASMAAWRASSLGQAGLASASPLAVGT
jgi:hypothetical protein